MATFITTKEGPNAAQRGSAIVIALFVLALISVFVALALSRTSAEALAIGNETAEARTFYAAQGSLEVMTRNFNKIYETRLYPTTADLNTVRNAPVPGLANFTFQQELDQTSTRQNVVLTGGPYSGLYAMRDTWRLRTTATDNQGVQVQLTRNILNNLVPIFQFGIFYDDDLEFHPGPRFDFGGRVHSNGSLFLQAHTGLYFSSRVTAKKHIYTDVAKNGSPWSNWDDNVYVKNASGNYVKLQYNMGSVLSSVVNGAPVSTNPWPTAYRSLMWPTNKSLFDGNLASETPSLQLPLKLNSDQTDQNLDLIEIVKRGKMPGDLYNDGTGTVTAPNIVPVTAATADDAITRAERYYNKTGIRISLADSKAKLPGCAMPTGAAVDTPCGVRLDGDSTGLTSGSITGVRGYVPRPMTGTPAYQATAINGNRFFTNQAGREVWIKVETVNYDSASSTYVTVDITQDILALGVTERAPNVSGSFVIQDTNYNTNNIDSRSVIKLQRFVIPGTANIPNTTGASSTTGYMTHATWNSTTFGFVMPATISSATSSNRCATATRTTVNGGTYSPNGFSGDNVAAMKTAVITGQTGKYGCVVPFPINMFDTREGLYNETTSVFDPAAAYGSNVPWAGVMSMVDIDVANLRSFLHGQFDAQMPTGTPFAQAAGRTLRSTDIPVNQGWVVYVSDRRGDFDFDGEYDMEDVFGGNDGILQPGEDVNNNGTLQAAYANEAVRYTGTGNHVSPDIAAVFEHRYYRRGVRLINASVVPGIYDSVNPSNTRGFTVASENAVYVLGNYNATGVANHGQPTLSTEYVPQNTANHIPSSIASDALVILSNNWRDGNSFTSPFSLSGRKALETTMRFGLISGDSITTLNGTPNQGGGDPRMSGGVHNFARFLEEWGKHFNYAGSLINLYNSRNNNGTFKCCTKVYTPPDRNWVFDVSFLDVNRLPPGTPYFQYAQTTGFQRTND